VALVVLYFAGWGQLDALVSFAYGQLLATTLLAAVAVSALLLHRRRVLDSRLGSMREELRLLFPFARTERQIEAFRSVIVSLEKRAVGKKGHETLYPVDLDGVETRLRVDSVGLWEHAVPLAEALAGFLRLPLLFLVGLVGVFCLIPLTLTGAWSRPDLLSFTW